MNIKKYLCKNGIVVKESLDVNEEYTVILANDLKDGQVINYLDYKILNYGKNEIENFVKNIVVEDDLIILKKCFEKLNLVALNSALVKIESIKKSETVDDLFYRMVYNSAKMYNLKYYIYEIIDAVISALGEETPQNEFDRLATIIRLNFSPVTVESLKRLMTCVFKGNELDIWTTHQEQLSSNFISWVKLSEHLLETLKQIRLRKSFLSLKNKTFITSKEASAMCFWSPLGHFRYEKEDSEYFKLLDLFR